MSVRATARSCTDSPRCTGPHGTQEFGGQVVRAARMHLRPPPSSGAGPPGDAPGPRPCGASAAGSGAGLRGTHGANPGRARWRGLLGNGGSPMAGAAPGSGGEHRQHAGGQPYGWWRAISPPAKADQRHIAQRAAHDLQLGAGPAKSAGHHGRHSSHRWRRRCAVPDGALPAAPRLAASAAATGSGISSAPAPRGFRRRCASGRPGRLRARWQNASRTPGSARLGDGHARRPRSSPMMWRTRVSAPKLPVRGPSLRPGRPGASALTSVARTTAARRCRRGETPRSLQQHVQRRLAVEREHQVAVGRGHFAHRRHRQAALRDARHQRHALRRRPRRQAAAEHAAGAPWPRMLPLPPTANCSTSDRLEARPPNR